MCGIGGGEHLEQVMAALRHRGRSTATVREPFPLGHVLHPVVGHVPQPVHGTGVLVANCEIYNWQDLANATGIEARNDADLLLHLLDRDGIEALDRVDGVYAFAYVRGDELILARDPLGVKPIWYSTEPFAFASEKQALEHAGLTARELHPRHVLRYDIATRELTTDYRGFHNIDETEMDPDEAAGQVADRLQRAVSKRVPDQETALLFSGGVDSTLIAAVFQSLDIEFTGYTAGIQYGNVNAPRDVDWAERVADRMGFDLETGTTTIDDLAARLPVLADALSTTNPVKLGVAATFDTALQGGERTVFSGLGSEQLYAGYDRQQGYLNKECLSGLRRLWERDLYRDDVVAMRHGYELRVPFLDRELVAHALTIPPEHKVREGYRKYVLRVAAEHLGVPEDVAWRRKTAAQYGSNMDKALTRIAKQQGYRHKTDYTASLREQPNHRLGVLFSGGKDSNAALHRMQRRHNEIACLINLQSRNPDSYMFDTKEQDLIMQQSERLDIPLLTQKTVGEKETELADLETAIQRAVNEYGIEGIVAGALASTYQRDRVEAAADRVGVKVFAPLWQEDPAQYMKRLVRDGFKIKITKTAAHGLDDTWEGRILDTEYLDALLGLANEYRFNPAGEGGEYETLVMDAPTFQDAG